jgi:hypothetical protein
MNVRYYRASDPQDANRQLQAWVDSDWAQCSDTRRPWTSILNTLAGDAVHYRSSMKKSIATSSAEAEYVAEGIAAKDIKWLRTLAKNGISPWTRNQRLGTRQTYVSTTAVQLQ